MARRKAEERKVKEVNWMQRLYEINERDLTPGSKFMRSLGTRAPKAPKPGRRRNRKQGAAGVYLSKGTSSDGDQG